MLQAIALTPLLVVVLTHATTAQDSVVGKWLPGFDHDNNNTNQNYKWSSWAPPNDRYMAMHMVLIPKSTPFPAPIDVRGWVMVWTISRVLVGGGDDNAQSDKRTTDYQIYEPPYLFRGPRPVVAGIPPTNLIYNAVYQIDNGIMIDPFVVEKVVLMRPGSVTHNTCNDQRCIVMEMTENGITFVKFRTPPTSNLAPRGWYMLFLVSNCGVPSVATWVKLK